MLKTWRHLKVKMTQTTTGRPALSMVRAPAKHWWLKLRRAAALCQRREGRHKWEQEGMHNR
jgi:hypothetical protein